MEFMASNSYNRSACRRPWQKSMDSQEFGFASNLINSMEVAAADELFFKGQLLPLQMDPRLHLVQALSNCAQAGSRGEPISRISYGCQDEGVNIDYNSSTDCPSNCDQGLQRQLSMLSWCKDIKESHSCRIEADMDLNDFKASLQNHKQAPPCDQDAPAAPNLSIWCKDEDIKGPWLSNWSKDEELSFNSCRIEGDIVDVHYKRSSSFRSQNSGFWESSGADKDTGDSSSSSRDSNGSSQDSNYLPNTTKLEITPSFTAHNHPHTKASFNIFLWKPLFKKASKKQTSSSPISISRMGYSEDLSKYKECSAPSLKEAKEAILLPWKLNEQRSTCNQLEKKGKGKGMPSSNDRSISGFKTKSSLCDAAKEDVASPNKSTATSKSLMSKGKGRIDNGNEEMKMKQKSAAIKERWQGYARRLRPLYEIKKGLMGQFRMDECGKRACEVESGNIYAGKSPMQRRLSHQSSLFESHKLIIQEQNRGNSHAHKGMNNMLAMSSCPPSTRSSPNHSGVLAVIDVKHKSTTAAAATIQVAEHCTRKTMNTSANISKDASSHKVSTNSNKNSKANSNIAFPSSNYSSVSTMHELHSALQSAIAHCKESNKRLDCLA